MLEASSELIWTHKLPTVSGVPLLGHFSAKKVVVGWDARQTSAEFADAVSSGIMDAGGDVLDIGMSGTEEMYWCVTDFKADAGIIVTASHNPINYNGMKIVKSGSRPLDDEADFKVIKKLAEDESWSVSSETGREVIYRAGGKGYICLTNP